MALPDLHLYYLASQLKYLGPWTTSSTLAAPKLHLASHVSLPILWPILEKSTISHHPLHPNHKVAQKAWSEDKNIAQYHYIPAESPLWHNIYMDQLILSQDSMFWSSHGLFSLNQLFSSNMLLSFAQLQQQFQILHQFFFINSCN